MSGAMSKGQSGKGKSKAGIDDGMAKARPFYCAARGDKKAKTTQASPSEGQATQSSRHLQRHGKHTKQKQHLAFRDRDSPMVLLEDLSAPEFFDLPRILMEPNKVALPSMADSFIEGQALEFYRRHVVADVARFSSKDLDEFWSRYILQQSVHSALVRQSLVAVGRSTMDTEYRRNAQGHASSSAPVLSLGAAQARGKVINMLNTFVKENEDPDRSIVLTCAVVLYHLEKSLGKESTARMHLENALSIFVSWPSPPTTSSDASFTGYETLRTLLTRLDIMSTIEDLRRRPKTRSIVTLPPIIINPDIPTLEILTQLQDFLLMGITHPLLIHNQQLLSSPLSTASSPAPDAVPLFHPPTHWTESFNTFLTDRGPFLTAAHHCRVITLQAWTLVCQCLSADPDYASSADYLSPAYNPWDLVVTEILRLARRSINVLGDMEREEEIDIASSEFYCEGEGESDEAKTLRKEREEQLLKKKHGLKDFERDVGIKKRKKFMSPYTICAPLIVFASKVSGREMAAEVLGYVDEYRSAEQANFQRLKETGVPYAMHEEEKNE